MIWTDTAGAAKIRNQSPRSLERERIEGKGPAFFRLGRSVRYLSDPTATDPDSVESWIKQRVVHADSALKSKP